MRKGLWTALLALVFSAAALVPALVPTILAAGRLDVVRVELAEKSLPPGGLQIVQITLGNVGRDAILAGLKLDRLNESQQRIGSPQTRQVKIPAKEEIGVLFRRRVPPKPGPSPFPSGKSGPGLISVAVLPLPGSPISTNQGSL